MIFSGGAVNASCGKLCDWSWWIDATEVELKEEISLGSNVMGRVIYDGDTPLHEAAMYGDQGLYPLLIQHGADISAINDRGLTPLLAASSYGPEKNRHKRLKKLLELGANIENETEDGKNALNLVAGTGSFKVEPSYEAVKLLIDTGVEIDKQDNQGISALHLASKFASPKVLSLLLENGANIQLRDAKGNSSLHYASEGKYPENLGILIQSGLDVNTANEQADTPLHRAVWFNRIENVTKLAEQKLNLDAQNNDGDTALHKSLESAAAAHNKFLMSAGSFSQINRLQILELLISKGANFNKPNQSGNTALHIAAELGTVDDVEKILQGNPFLFALNNKDKTAFDLAYQNERLKNTKMHRKMKPTQ